MVSFTRKLPYGEEATYTFDKKRLVAALIALRAGLPFGNIICEIDYPSIFAYELEVALLIDNFFNKGCVVVAAPVSGVVAQATIGQADWATKGIGPSSYAYVFVLNREETEGLLNG